MTMNPSQIKFAASVIATIDTGEREIFLETVNTCSQIKAEIFYNADKMVGVFYSCLFFDELKIYISFISDTDMYNENIAANIRSTFKTSGKASCLIWTAKKFTKSRVYLKEEFNIQPDATGDYYAPNANGYYYEAVEFIMRRKNFNKTADNKGLTIRPFEEKHLGKYVSLLNETMVLDGLPPNFQGSKDFFLKPFEERIRDNSFEAFWKDGKLVGMYWYKNSDIDIIAVAKNQQRKGYGSFILSRAIEQIYQNATKDYARLYIIAWNENGLRFCQKYGMEKKGHCYLLRIKEKEQ